MTAPLFAADPAVHDKIAELFGGRIDRAAAPGSIVAVFTLAEDGRPNIELSSGFGVARLGAGDSPDLDTAFRIASCSKSFAAAAVLLLRDRGLLNLDAPITDFVPEFRFARGDGTAAAPQDGDETVPTVRMLLSMSGGLATDDPWGDRQESLSDDDFRAVIATGIPRDSLPGTRFEYSNYGFALLGRVVAAVSGAPFTAFVARELFAPLGLTATGYDVAARDGIPGSLATGYRKAHDGSWVALPHQRPGAFSPIGGVVTTARDLVSWAAWMLGALDPETTVPGPLAASTRREMQQVWRTIPGAREGAEEFGYASGLFVEKGPRGHLVSHSGGYPGFSAHMRWHAPGRFGVVAFENATYAGVSVPVVELVDFLAERAGRIPRPPRPWDDTVALARRVDALLDAWPADDASAAATGLFSPNVALDAPFAERAAAIAALGLRPAGAEPELEASGSPARVAWTRTAADGDIRIELLATPTVPAQVQSLRFVRREAAGSEGL